MTGAPIAIDPIYGCHLWQGRLDKRGYGRTKSNALAHRAIYLDQRGQLPPKKPELDHLCRRRHCVNPRHLEPVSRRENERRKLWRRRSQVKSCPRGHDLFTYGRLTPEGGKVCRRCDG